MTSKDEINLEKLNQDLEIFYMKILCSKAEKLQKDFEDFNIMSENCVQGSKAMDDLSNSLMERSRALIKDLKGIGIDVDYFFEQAAIELKKENELKKEKM